ncbi:MAG: hypothetical protein NWE93_14660 [Candidatus Bathyarchaeota archaeon]|nr:hypothetical protein [Candidatus Bathyarchaeota archaeon]
MYHPVYFNASEGNQTVVSFRLRPQSYLPGCVTGKEMWLSIGNEEFIEVKAMIGTENGDVPGFIGTESAWSDPQSITVPAPASSATVLDYPVAPTPSPSPTPTTPPTPTPQPPTPTPPPSFQDWTVSGIVVVLVVAALGLIAAAALILIRSQRHA